MSKKYRARVSYPSAKETAITVMEISPAAVPLPIDGSTPVEALMLLHQSCIARIEQLKSECIAIMETAERLILNGQMDELKPEERNRDNAS